MKKFEQIKTHLSENKKTYVGVGVGVLVGAAAATVALHNKTEVAQKINLVAVGYKNNQVLVNFVERSTPSKPVHLKGTNLYFDSLSDAARKTGHHLSMISKNVNGHIPDVKGDVFVLLDKAS